MPRLGKNTILSFWEHKGWCQERDIVVIGAGFVGLSAAVESRKMYPDAKITVVELSPLCGGGSTKNAGFGCFGSPSELLDDWGTLGPEKTVELVAQRFEGLNKLRENYSDEKIGYQATGAIEMFTNVSQEDQVLEARVRAFLPELNEALEPVFKAHPFKIVDDIPVGVMNASSVISSPFEGILDTSMLYSSAKKEALDTGVEMINGVKILGIEEDGRDGYRLDFDFGYFEAGTVLVAGNAFAKELLEDLDVSPKVNRVLVTEEIPGLRFEGSCHYDRGYVYLRRLENRMLIGGGRQWAQGNSDALSDGGSEEVRAKLVEFLGNHIEGCKGVEIEYNWIGHLGVGASRDPIVKTVKPGLHVGVRMGGMGVAIGREIGVKLARLQHGGRP